MWSKPNDLEPAEKLAILKAWEVDERALLRAEDEGMGGGEHAHLHKVQAALDHLRQESCKGSTVASISASATFRSLFHERPSTSFDHRS